MGKPIESVEYRFADDDELLVRGPFVFAGYWHKPDATREAIESDGWFHTGDIGRVDDDGFLYITDRKKELLKTSGGKMIAPQPIESKLNHSPLVASSLVVGDRHKFLSVLIAPNFPALESLAAQAGNRLQLSRRSDRQSSGAGGIPCPNQPRQPRSRKFRDHQALLRGCRRVVHGIGEFTPTMKLRRRVVVNRYADDIAAIYHDKATAQR